MNTALPIPIETKQAICQTCEPRRCCYHYRVHLTGFDLFRISSLLDLAPEQFATFVETEADDPDGFTFDASGARYALVLAKSTDTRCFGGCVFLVRTNDGTHRCGLDNLKPAQCGLYPAYVHDGLVRVINDPSGCWRTWSIRELDVFEEQKRANDYAKQKKHYQQCVTMWNRKVAQHKDRQFEFREYCDFVQNHYAGQRSVA